MVRLVGQYRTWTIWQYRSIWLVYELSSPGVPESANWLTIELPWSGKSSILVHQIPDPTPSPEELCPSPRQWVWNHSARGAYGHFYKWLSTEGTWGKQETHQSVLPVTKAPAKMTNGTRRAKKLQQFSIYENDSGTPAAVGCSRLDRSVAIRGHCPSISLLTSLISCGYLFAPWHHIQWRLEAGAGGTPTVLYSPPL